MTVEVARRDTNLAIGDTLPSPNRSRRNELTEVRVRALGMPLLRADPNPSRFLQCLSSDIS